MDIFPSISEEEKNPGNFWQCLAIVATFDKF